MANEIETSSKKIKPRINLNHNRSLSCSHHFWFEMRLDEHKQCNQNKLCILRVVCALLTPIQPCYKSKMATVWEGSIGIHPTFTVAWISCVQAKVIFNWNKLAKYFKNYWLNFRLPSHFFYYIFWLIQKVRVWFKRYRLGILQLLPKILQLNWTLQK